MSKMPGTLSKVTVVVKEHNELKLSYFIEKDILTEWKLLSENFLFLNVKAQDC